MSTERRLARDLPDILGELARGRYPEYIDDVLVRTAQLRQRPAWTFIETWLPMAETARQLILAPRLPWRAISIALILIALLLAAVVVLSIGNQTRLPAPYGLARNGLVAYEVHADIFTVDPVSGAATAIVTGPPVDIAPRFSLDGTHVIFERRLATARGQLYVARSDGTGLTLVTPDPVLLTRSLLGEPWDAYQFSPDGHSILIASSEDGLAGIAIAHADGSGVTRLDVGMQVYEPSFRPPDGAEILFVGSGSPEQGHGLFAVDPSTGAVRTIIGPSSAFDLAGASWSPDGTRIAYSSWDRNVPTFTARTHVVSADGSRDLELPAHPDAVWNAGSRWSNDGKRLVVARGYGPAYEDVRAVLIPADGSSLGVEVHQHRTLVANCCAAWLWSPDDTTILVTPAGTVGEPLQQVIIDPSTEASRDAPWTATSDPTWQRLAREPPPPP